MFFEYIYMCYFSVFHCYNNRLSFWNIYIACYIIYKFSIHILTIYRWCFFINKSCVQNFIFWLHFNDVSRRLILSDFKVFNLLGKSCSLVQSLICSDATTWQCFAFTLLHNGVNFHQELQVTNNQQETISAKRLFIAFVVYLSGV